MILIISLISKFRCFICLVESQSVKEEGTLLKYGDHISSEDKVSYKIEDEDNSLKKPESILISGEVEGISYFTNV